MAINPATQVAASKIDTSDPTGYPYGKAQDILAPGDGKGTPRLALLVNDIFGFQQAMLKEASPEIVPSETPDKVGASQYLEALINIIVQNSAASVPDAEETVKGILELATQAETNAEADDLTAVTPLKLGAWATFKAFLGVTAEGSNANGEFVHFSNGLKLQWRESALNVLAGATAAVSFPIAFTTTTPFVVVMDTTRTDPQINVGYTARTASGFTASNSGSGSAKDFNWFAIGI